MNANSEKASFDFEIGLEAREDRSVRAVKDRREERHVAVRQVEYTPFPRVPTGRQRRMGFTRNLSGSGLCFRAEEAQPVGSLLRVVVRSVDGRPALESVARIAWCEPSAEGAWLGLSLVESRSARGWQGMEAGRS